MGSNPISVCESSLPIKRKVYLLDFLELENGSLSCFLPDTNNNSTDVLCVNLMVL